ncbi:MAG: spore cortex-lytic enzyme [Peptococcaceae bacterium]
MGNKRTRAIALILILAGFMVFVGMDFISILGYRTLVYGATGQDVKNLQSKLKDLGYHSAEIDGMYGWQTLKSVKWFQSRFGLKVDGVVGPATWAALNKARPGTVAARSSTNTAASSNDVAILAKMITGEARGEPYIGQVAVAAVIMNRVESSKFPDTVYSVCFQPGAFDAVRDGQYFTSPTTESLKAAREAINGYDPTYGALYYWNPATATSRWIWSRKIMLRIGEHVFGL